MQRQLMRQGQPVIGRWALGCATAFAAPFCLMGLFTVKEGLGQLASSKPSAWMLVAMGSLFAAVGVLIIIGAWVGMRSVSHAAAAVAERPDEPWLWREDWAQGTAREEGGVAAPVMMWIFAVMWCVMSSPLVVIVRREVKDNPALVVALLFPLVGVILLCTALYGTMRRLRYGKSVCHFGNTPLAIGHTVHGDVELHSGVAPEAGWKLHLACVRAVTTGTGKSRHTKETVLWDDERTVPAMSVTPSPVGLRVPFDFVTPPGAASTDLRDSVDRLFWRLSVSAEVPGIDYKAAFLLPFFAVGPADAGEFASFAASQRATAAMRPLEPASGITVTPQPDGSEEFRVKPPITFSATVSSLVFLAIWSAAVAAMFYFKAPIAIPIVFALLELLILWGFIDFVAGHTTLRAGREGLDVVRTVFGISSRAHFAKSEVASITAKADVQTSAVTVDLKKHDGTTRTLARALRDRADAEVLAARVAKALGL
jgi:hypothetical protein